MPLPKLIRILIFIFITSFILVGFGRQISTALDSGSRLDQAADQVNRLQEKNKQLKNKLSQVEQPDFIEEIARDKLNLARSSETMVIIQKEAISKILGLNQKIEEVKIPNWQGWLKLFIH